MCSCSDNNQTGQNASTELPVNLTIYQLNRINSDPKIYHFLLILAYLESSKWAIDFVCGLKD